MTGNTPSERQTLHSAWLFSDRDLRAIQALVILLLAVLLSYTVWLVYKKDWEGLTDLLTPATAACAALLVAKTATRLLAYSMFVRADDRAHDAVCCIHHSMAIVIDMRGRMSFMKLALSEGHRPLIALTQNCEAIQKRYETLYDRELYRYLPGDVVDEVLAMSGSIFGLSALVAGIASAMDNKGHQMIPSGKEPLRQKVADLEAKLDTLLTKLEELRNVEV